MTDIDKAHVYTREEAQKAWDGGREFDIPVSADHVDSETVCKVDSQHVPSETVIDEKYNKYVAYIKCLWSGNDLFWWEEG